MINPSSPGVMVPSNSASGSHGSEDQEMGVRSRGGASRYEFDDGEGENLVDGSYQLVELDGQEILAEHTHFCELCGKGFKRDANLRMHMRSHGDEYKTPEALARPQKPIDEQTPEIPKRFLCPHVGCKRSVKHREFQPLESLLCVMNHYRRSHCAKNLACSKCKVKKFSVVADLKKHEKHCGYDKWQCSCGTTFSRKDNLFCHVSMFVCHSPAALPLPENLAENSAGSLEIVDMAPVGSNVDSGVAESTSMVQQGLESQVSAGGDVDWTLLLYGAVTTGSGSSVHPSETVGVGNLRQPPPFNNRMAARPGAGSGMNGSGKASINRSSPGVMVPSNSDSGSHGSEDQEMGVRSRGGASRDEFDDGEGENLVDGSYQLVELDDQEILAEHTHFCELCGKGFKRDANLRMHMRSHGDEYKGLALARPQKPIDEQTPEIPKRFSCPHVGCRCNVKHRKFQPLKSLLCVKNHYRRRHCAKNLACSKCKVKKFSVVADLKTHEKHCGCDKWQCDKWHRLLPQA